LQARLSNHDIQQEVTAALQKRANFRGQLYTQNFSLGAVLIVLAGIGLAREQKIARMQKIIKQNTRPNRGPVEPFDNSGVTGAPPSVS
jgi:hypothetical protein